MLFSTSFGAFAQLVSLSSFAAAAPSNKEVKPPAFFLAGDSTTAIQTSGGGGWGTGFFTTTLQNSATGTNYGHNGATTLSFRSGGDWSTLLSAAKSAKSSSQPYVTIQFGHNDQKPAKNISMTEFTSNLVAFVDEVNAIGVTPILVTSLSRRRFSSSTGKINENLKDVVAATKEAAKVSGASIIDLNKASTTYLNAIGEEKSATYNLDADDFTHLNSEGSVVFGNMVAMLIREALPELKKYVVPVDEVEEAIEKGEYYFPVNCTGNFC